MNSVIEEIKRRIDIVDYIAQLIPLKKVGENYIGLCPFHTENAPSFIVSRTKNIATCFGKCNETFDIISLTQKYFHVSLYEALNILGIIVGISNNMNQHIINKNKKFKIEYFGEEGKYIYEERFSISAESDDIALEKCHELAVGSLHDYYKQTQIRVFSALLNFLKDNFDLDAYNYLIGPERGLVKETIEKFGLVSITDVRDTGEFLKDNFSTEEIKISGLFSDKGRFIFSDFRIIIPYLENGVPIYLRARYFKNGSCIPEDNNPKYIGLNNRSSTLTAKRFFNIDILKQPVAAKEILLVEGEFDAMILSQINLPAIAIPGINNLPKDISPLTNRKIYLCLDNDGAGKIATLKISEVLKTNNIELRTIKFKSNYKDFTQWINAIL
jgi:DNA primase